ncbi:CHAT domain-containing protein [Dactylosporangium sp. CA-092794]|uniref:CHAT domain-containing protein n=1 Tax=Dactylosporangium sp. CA-092794 TaxID=3239929 RepID=UPI003D945F49
MLALRSSTGELVVIADDGTAAMRFGALDLAGGWTRDGEERLLALGGAGRAVDGYLSPAPAAPGRWAFDGTAVDRRAAGAGSGWLALRLSPVPEGEVPPALLAVAGLGPLDAPAPALAAAPATPEDLLEPVFDVVVHPEQDGVRHPTLAATLQLLPEGGAWTVSWTTDGPIGPGWVRWFATGFPAGGDGPRDTGELTLYRDWDQAFDVPGTLELRFDGERLAVEGELRAEAGGHHWVLRYTGRVRGHRVEALRRRLARPSLRGDWAPIAGVPAPPGLPDIIGLGDGERAALAPRGFVRLGATVDDAVGLVAAGGGWAPVRLGRVLDPPGEYTAEERTALRFLATDAAVAGQEAVAAALRAAAEPLYAARDDVSADVSRLLMANARIRGAYRAADYPALVDGIVAALDLQPRLVELARGGPARELTDVTGVLESWRDMLAADAERIDALERSAPVFDRLVGLLAALGDPHAALVASEQSRARAFADLLHRPARTPPVTRATLDGVDRPFVEYFMSGRRLTVWTGDGRGALEAAVTDVDPDRLRADVDAVRALLEAPVAGAATEAELVAVLTRLGATLWGPVATRLLPDDPDALVVVVPHRELLLLPFAALRSGGRPLVERHAIAVLPALAVLPGLAARRDAAAGRPPELVALVNPAPTAGGDPRLDRTEALFPDIAEQYPPGAATVFAGRRASAETLRRECGRGTVLYLGTHAHVADDDGQGFVSLARTAADDGRLHVARIAGLRIAAGLVILAMCRSGRGAAGADGVVGLSRAFLAAGPHVLITALGEVGEESALDLLTVLHAYWLGDGLDLAVAWRRAQRDLARTARHHAWAPFVLFGLPG